jgi:hypothetical protein
MIQQIKETAIVLVVMAVATAIVLTIASLLIGADAINHINGL